jgi:glycerol-3-phosphate dehydrogenase
MEAPQDRRAIFLLPWHEHCMIGTTEHTYHGDPASVRPLEQEERYLLEVLHHYFPERPDRVIARFSGLRVLPAADGTSFPRSRETRLTVDRRGQPRVVSIYGGKLTGYRATAQKVMRLLARSLPPRKPVAYTGDVKLVAVD